MTIRLVVITEIIAPYRIPVFNALAKLAEVDLHVIFLAENDPTMRDWRVYRDEINFPYEVLPSWRRRIVGRNLLLNWGMSTALDRFSPDAIVCGGYNYAASWQALLWAKRKHVRFLLWMESHAKDRRTWFPLRDSLKSTFMRKCDGFVVPGRASFNDLKNRGFAEQNIFTAPNAVDNLRFSAGAESARQSSAILRKKLGLPNRFFLFVGRLTREKGVFDLLQAYQALALEMRSEIGLIFVGAGPALDELRRSSAALEAGQVQILGFLHREELPYYYGLAEAFVFPTWSDPWGLVVNEAMACALPVIATDVAGCVPDLVQDGWNGVVLPVGDTQRLSSALQLISQNQEMRAAMGRRSLERIQLFSPQLCAAGFVAAANPEARIDG